MGISLGLVGGGGSILTVPILVYFFKQDPLIATSSSLFIVGATAFVGAIFNARKKLVDFKTGLLFALPSFTGVFTARHFLLPLIPDHIASIAGFSLTKSILIMSLFGIIMVLAARAMIFSSRKNTKLLSTKPQRDSTKTLTIIWQGFFIGITTGFVGAGGGFLIIPALVMLLNLPMKLAIGTSLAIIAANSFFGFALSSANIYFDWFFLLKITTIGIFGIAIGQFYSSKVNENALKRWFGYFVLSIGSFVILDQIFNMI